MPKGMAVGCFFYAGATNRFFHRVLQIFLNDVMPLNLARARINGMLERGKYVFATPRPGWPWDICVPARRGDALAQTRAPDLVDEGLGLLRGARAEAPRGVVG